MANERHKAPHTDQFTADYRSGPATPQRNSLYLSNEPGVITEERQRKIKYIKKRITLSINEP